MEALKEEKQSEYLSFGLKYYKKWITLINLNAGDTLLYDGPRESALKPWLTEFQSSGLTVKLQKEGDSWQIISSKQLLVNGVGWQKRTLKDGDILFFGPYRLKFEGNHEPLQSVPPIPHRKKTIWRLQRLAEAAMVIASVSFLWFCVSLNHQESDSVSSGDKVNPGPSHETEPAYAFTEDLDNTDNLPDFSAPEEPATGEDHPLLVYAPGEEPAGEKLDVLFIHAHPDDESLDYGLYLARLAKEGKSAGAILFTDGESGLDSFPDRPVTEPYSNAYLKGKALARVRVKEATKALKVLGARVYVRLGLWNRPYTAEQVSKSTATIISEWGGEKYLVDKLVHLMELFHPDVIVSPDGPSSAWEHFEHEAVGYLAGKAVDVYLKKHPEKLVAYLKLVDVQQTDAYPGVPLLHIESAEGSPLLQEKKLALMKHLTQNDACYFGIKRLHNYPFEQYMISYNSMGSNLALLQKKVGVELPTGNF